MTDQSQNTKLNGHGDYERRDIRAADVWYFLAALIVSGLIANFVVMGVYHELEKRSQQRQPTLSPLVTNVPEDTRHLAPAYTTDAASTDYEKYLKANFPAPQLETDERTQLNTIITMQEDVLNSYGYVDQKAGTVRIPIERAMDLIAQRGLPARPEGSSAMPTQTEAAAHSSQARADQARDAAQKQNAAQNATQKKKK
jgi:hypothetical protein